MRGQIIAPAAKANTLSAICSEPNGKGNYYKDGKSEIDDDKLTGATTTYSWNTDTKKATVVMQDSQGVGGAPSSYEAIVIPVTKNQVAFLFVYEHGIELHSLFLDLGVAMMSPQKDYSFLSPKSAVGRILRAECKISFD